jgi:hypothetical protein
MEQLAVGPVEIQVDRHDQGQARELLESLAEGDAGQDFSGMDADEVE